MKHCIGVAGIVSDGAVQPDITQTVVTLQTHTGNTPNNNHIASSDKADMYSDNTINLNRSLLLDEPSTPRKSATDLSHKGSKISLKSRPQSTYSENMTANRRSMISCQLPANIDPDALVWASVTHTGGRITLPNAGKQK